MNLSISSSEQAELDLLRRSVETFCKQEVTPYYTNWEEQGMVPRQFWNKLGEQGFLLPEVPEEYGGLGASFLYSTTIIESFCRQGYSSIAANLSVHDTILANYFLQYGTEEQKKYYLPRMISGELVGAIAMTEPGAGSDLQRIKTTANFDKGLNGYVLNGSKTFITNGQHCDFAIVVANTKVDVKPSKGISLFIVDAKKNGFTKGKNLEKIGLHACDTSELYFEDILLDESDILGGVNQGFSVLMNELPRERLIVANCAVASMEGVLTDTVSYVKERELFGTTLDQFQHTQFTLAELQTKVRVQRSFADECTTRCIEGNLDTATASMAKLSCTEVQGEVIDRCLQLFGGYGYMLEYPIARAYADARVQRIYGGTSEVMKLIISRELLSK